MSTATLIEYEGKRGIVFELGSGLVLRVHHGGVGFPAPLVFWEDGTQTYLPEKVDVIKDDLWQDPPSFQSERDKAIAHLKRVHEQVQYADKEVFEAQGRLHLANEELERAVDSVQRLRGSS